MKKLKSPHIFSEDNGKNRYELKVDNPISISIKS